MTLPDERLRALFAMERVVLSLITERWPTATEGRRRLRRALRHYPTAMELARALPPELVSREELRALASHAGDRARSDTP